MCSMDEDFTAQAEARAEKAEAELAAMEGIEDSWAEKLQRAERSLKKMDGMVDTMEERAERAENGMANCGDHLAEANERILELEAEVERLRGYASILEHDIAYMEAHSE